MGGGGVKANLIFFLPEGGFKTNFNKKVGGPRQINFSVYNLRSEYIFFEWEGKAGRGVIAFTAEA